MKLAFNDSFFTGIGFIKKYSPAKKHNRHGKCVIFGVRSILSSPSICFLASCSENTIRSYTKINKHLLYTSRSIVKIKLTTASTHWTVETVHVFFSRISIRRVWQLFCHLRPIAEIDIYFENARFHIYFYTNCLNIHTI